MRRSPLVNTCGLEECSSSCHAVPGVPGPYCAPLRCYCGGCPSHVPVVRSSGPITQAELDARAAALEALARAEREAAVPITQAPPAMAELRAQLAEATELAVGPALHRARRHRALRSS
jgi:hypothetical protein